MRMPSDAELRAHAAQLGVDLAARGARARVARSLLTSAAPDEQPEQLTAGDGALLSSVQHAVPGGVLQVEVSFYATSASPPDDQLTDDPVETTEGA